VASKTEDAQAKARLKALSAPDDPEIKAYNWNTICDVASIQTRSFGMQMILRTSKRGSHGVTDAIFMESNGADR